MKTSKELCQKGFIRRRQPRHKDNSNPRNTAQVSTVSRQIGERYSFIMENNHTLYIVGGLSRTGKSKIADKIQEQKLLFRFNTDEIRDGIKAIIRYGPQKVLQGNSMEITLRVPKTIKQPSDLENLNIKFVRNDDDENSYGWDGIVHILNFYDAKNECDLLIEGVAIKPELIRELRLKNFIIKGVFIGFGNDSMINNSIIKFIVNYSMQNEDHFYRQWDGNPEKMKADLENTIRNYNKDKPELERRIKECGCEHFDRTEHFEEDIQAVISLLNG